MKEDNGLSPPPPPITTSSSSGSSNWAVLVSSSKYFFNYRHHGNVLNIYELLKRQGFDDDHIIVFDALQAACDPRNTKQGEMHTYLVDSATTTATAAAAAAGNGQNVYLDTITDYKGDEVSTDSFLRLLTGKYSQNTINSKKLLSDSGSNVMIYLSGHGGDEFFKFRDVDELTSSQLSAAIVEMKSQGRFQNLLVVADTCKAATLLYPNSLPPFVGNVSFIASSQKDENSFGWHSVAELEVAIIDRFSFKFAESIRSSLKKKKDPSIKSIVNSIDPRFLMSHASFESNSREEKLLPISTFFTATSTSSKSPKASIGKPIYDNNNNDDGDTYTNYTNQYNNSNIKNRFAHVKNRFMSKAPLSIKKSDFLSYSPPQIIPDVVYNSYYYRFKLLLIAFVFIVLILKINR